VGGRDRDGVTRIGSLYLDASDLRHVVSVSSEPHLDVGEAGCFDESGTSYPCAVQHSGKWYLYYTGWMVGGRVPFRNAVGLAISDDGQKFERVSRAPILERTNAEPIGTGSVLVRHDDERWQMWYTCFVNWFKEPGGTLRHFYHIRMAV